MQFQKLFSTLFFIFWMLFGFSCASSEIGESKDVAQETIYQQYNISYNEGEDSASINAIFRFAGEKGTTLVLTNPSSLQLDGIPLRVDSSDFEGAFYRKYLPVKNFYSAHQFAFTDINNRQYVNPFSFDVFTLSNIPGIADKRQAIHIQVEPIELGTDDYIEIGALETDSSFSITYSSKDTNRFITIPAEELQRQKGGKLKLAATLYRKVPLQQTTREGGILEMQYALKPITILLK